MIDAASLREVPKLLRFGRNFLGRRLVHTNLQLLYACNFRCRICDFWRPGERRGQLSLEAVERISGRLARLGPQIVSIGGGEPLLHPDIVGVVRALRRHHFPVMICNGWFVTAERARALWQAGMYEISVSVDYNDPGRHDEQRGVEGAFDRALAALRILNETRTRPWQRVHMITVIMADNHDDVGPLIERCRGLGITYLLTLYSDQRGDKDAQSIAPGVGTHLLELRRRHPELVALRGYMERFDEAIREGGAAPCYAGRNLCNIDSQGQVSLCIDRKDEAVGNILTDDVRDLERRLLQAHRGNRCAACWTSCRGSIETLMYGRRRLQSLGDYLRMVRPLPIPPSTAPGPPPGPP